MINSGYDNWINENCLCTGDIVEFFNETHSSGVYYGMIMMYDKTPVVIYKDGFDYLNDVFRDIRYIYRPNHPAYYSPWQWWEVKGKITPFYTSDKRYVTKEELEEELGYKIEII